MINEENKSVFIGAQIKKAREEAGMSQMDLARSLRFESGTAISLIEGGERKVTAENLALIANVLHRDIKYFLGEDECKTVDVKVALRADKNISSEDKDAILHFIEMAKNKHERGN
ncbi:MAG: helix-turn-helix transcriptional regulator [bacterium]